ncbi:IS1096 element passenger TnpR family protein [Methylovulum miyakonense]|uniref:IS1096 element passenger TnpR family protein n=1 Tax=Methylovulum miyakonense TaxID=645578 RepID=UPI00036F1612|nr:hypothetical protein [Methylovulum miyakonense]
MIWTFKIKLAFTPFTEQSWAAEIEIDSSATLEELHLAIQDAVEFENDHLYEFYISKTESSYHPSAIRFDDEEEGFYSSVTLENVYPLETGKSLYYLFDYGDNWLFKITKSRKKPHGPQQGISYPHRISEIGERPVQYPDFDE